MFDIRVHGMKHKKEKNKNWKFKNEVYGYIS